MKNFPIPTREEVTPANQVIFDNLKKMAGRVPNLFAVFAHSDHALGTYMNFQNARTSVKAKEREVINLVVSQYNRCEYCLAAHTALAKMNGFSDEQVLEIRKAEISFDPKLGALAKLVKSIVENKGHAPEGIIDDFYKAGYTHGTLMETILVIGDKIISNYVYALTNVPVDWPAAPAL